MGVPSYSGAPGGGTPEGIGLSHLLRLIVPSPLTSQRALHGRDSSRSIACAAGGPAPATDGASTAAVRDLVDGGGHLRSQRAKEAD